MEFLSGVVSPWSAADFPLKPAEFVTPSVRLIFCLIRPPDEPFWKPAVPPERGELTYIQQCHRSELFWLFGSHVYI